MKLLNETMVLKEDKAIKYFTHYEHPFYVVFEETLTPMGDNRTKVERKAIKTFNTSLEAKAHIAMKVGK